MPAYIILTAEEYAKRNEAADWWILGVVVIAVVCIVLYIRFKG